MSEIWRATRLEESTEALDVAATRGPERRARVLWRIDPWSVLKVSLGLYMSAFAVLLGVAVALWMAARLTGILGNLEGFIEAMGPEGGSFHFRGTKILVFALLTGPIFAVLGSIATVAGVAIFNVVVRLMGGIQMTVGDERARRR